MPMYRLNATYAIHVSMNNPKVSVEDVIKPKEYFKYIKDDKERKKKMDAYFLLNRKRD